MSKFPNPRVDPCRYRSTGCREEQQEIVQHTYPLNAACKTPGGVFLRLEESRVLPGRVLLGETRLCVS